MQRQDIPHFTSEEVEAVVVEALALIDNLDPPTDLRAAVFTQAASMLAAKSVQIVQPQPIDLGAIAQGMRRQ